jgi:hypothetical protein
MRSGPCWLRGGGGRPADTHRAAPLDELFKASGGGGGTEVLFGGCSRCLSQSFAQFGIARKSLDGRRQGDFVTRRHKKAVFPIA